MAAIVISSVFSAVSLLVSITVAILTFRRGRLGMTHPSLIGFLWESGAPKLFLRTMLYATGKRGYIIEALYLKIRCGDAVHRFNFWVYGETKAEIIGSGLRVGEEGVALNHYFLQPKNESFAFVSGEYVIEVHAKILNRRKSVRLSKVSISLSHEFELELRDQLMGVLFTWDAESGGYRCELSSPPAVGRDRSVSGSGGTTRTPLY